MSQTAAQDLNSLSDLAAVRTKLEISEKERSETEIQLRDSKQSVAALQEESRSYLKNIIYYIKEPFKARQSTHEISAVSPRQSCISDFSPEKRSRPSRVIKNVSTMSQTHVGQVCTQSLHIIYSIFHYSLLRLNDQSCFLHLCYSIY